MLSDEDIKQEETSEMAVKPKVRSSHGGDNALNDESSVSRLRKMTFNLQKILKLPDDVNALAFLMGIENFCSIEKQTKCSAYPLFVVMERAEVTGKVREDDVNLLIDALQMLSSSGNQACDEALDVVQKYKSENCDSVKKETVPVRKGTKTLLDDFEKKGKGRCKKFLKWYIDFAMFDPRDVTTPEEFISYLKTYSTPKTRGEHFDEIVPYLKTINIDMKEQILKDSETR